MQGFGGDYDYGDEDYDDEDQASTVQELEELDEYEGDFDGENDLSNNNPDDDLRRNFNVGPSYKINTRLPLNRHTYNKPYGVSYRIPKAVSGKHYFTTLDTLHAPVRRHNFSKKDAETKEKIKKNSYPEVIALVDEQYIRNTMSQNRGNRVPPLTRGRKRIPRLLLKYN